MSHAKQVVSRSSVEKSSGRKLLVLSEFDVLTSKTSNLAKSSGIGEMFMKAALVCLFKVPCVANGRTSNIATSDTKGRIFGVKKRGTCLDSD